MQSEELVESSDILVREMTDDGILRLTLDDQRRRNALSDNMLARLRQALDQAASDASVRVIVLAATGPAFCAGHDLKEMTRARQAQDGGRPSSPRRWPVVPGSCRRSSTIRNP